MRYLEMLMQKALKRNKTWAYTKEKGRRRFFMVMFKAMGLISSSYRTKAMLVSIQIWYHVPLGIAYTNLEVDHISC